jgi:hypothetical protein
MGMVGETYAVKFLERLSPEAVKKMAEDEPGVFESIERKCWRKYNALFGELSGASMEKEILTSIRKYTEKLILGADAAEALEN